MLFSQNLFQTVIQFKGLFNSIVREYLILVESEKFPKSNQNRPKVELSILLYIDSIKDSFSLVIFIRLAKIQFKKKFNKNVKKNIFN